MYKDIDIKTNASRAVDLCTYNMDPRSWRAGIPNMLFSAKKRKTTTNDVEQTKTYTRSNGAVRIPAPSWSSSFPGVDDEISDAGKDTLHSDPENCHKLDNNRTNSVQPNTIPLDLRKKVLRDTSQRMKLGVLSELKVPMISALNAGDRQRSLCCFYWRPNIESSRITVMQTMPTTRQIFCSETLSASHFYRQSSTIVLLLRHNRFAPAKPSGCRVFGQVEYFTLIQMPIAVSY